MRKFQLTENTKVTPCPICGNNTKFTAYSQQIVEDLCEIWVECNCGFDPTKYKTMYRLEDIWGGTDNGNVRGALDCWNDAIRVILTEKTDA